MIFFTKEYLTQLHKNEMILNKKQVKQLLKSTDIANEIGLYLKT